MSDELFKRIILGEEKAFEEVFNRNFKSMCFYSKLFGLSLEQAKEVVQQTFLRLWEIRSQLEPIGHVENYLYKAIRNNCLYYLRQQKSHSNYIDPGSNLSALENLMDGESSHDETLLFNELEHRFKSTLEHLPPQMRKIFILNRYDGFTYKEIAGKLNISVKTVETQMSRALAKLRVELKEYLPFLVFLSLKMYEG